MERKEEEILAMCTAVCGVIIMAFLFQILLMNGILV